MRVVVCLVTGVSILSILCVYCHLILELSVGLCVFIDILFLFLLTTDENQINSICLL